MGTEQPPRFAETSMADGVGPPDLVGSRGALAVRLDPASDGFAIQYAKAATTTFYPGSLTKLMTALLTVEWFSDPTMQLTVMEADLRSGSGNYFNTGDTLTLDAALHSLLIPSSNTIAESLARTVGQLHNRPEPRVPFLDLMNSRAAELGMVSTTYTNPSGLHDAAMLSSPRDVMLLLKEVAKHPKLVDILGKRHAQIEVAKDHSRIQNLRTTVHALDHPEVIAGKTGTRQREPAQYNLAAIARGRAGIFGLVQMGAESQERRDADTSALLRHLPLDITAGENEKGASPLTAQAVSQVTGGAWLRMPPPDWRLREAVRIRAAHTGGPTMSNVIIPVVEPARTFPRLERSKLDSSNVSLLVDQELTAETTRFPTLKVESIQEAMSALARHHRAAYAGKVIAVTGSVGKTTTTSLLTAALSGRFRTSSSQGRNGLPAIRAHCIELNKQSHAVFEVARIALPGAASLLRPDVAIVTAVAAAHMEDLKSLENVAQVKAQLFSGLDRSGTAVLNLDTPHSEILLVAAKQSAGRVITYGTHSDADAQLVRYDPTTRAVTLSFFGRSMDYQLGLDGKHNALNSIATLCAIHSLGEDVSRFHEFLKYVRPAKGRGTTEQLLIGGKRVTAVDQSHNANPTSMLAALGDFTTRFEKYRRVLVLGDMLELGPSESDLHAELLEPVLAANPAVVYLLGPLMTNLWSNLPEGIRGAHLISTKQLRLILESEVQEGDAVLLKASRATGIKRLTAAFRAEGERAATKETRNSEAWRITVSGPAVQGVGFRQWLKERALEEGVDGWVRNRADGKVEALLSGRKDGLERIYAHVHSGPEGAEISRVIARKVSITQDPGFRVRRERAV